MATCERDTSFATLDLPIEFADLKGLLQADIKAMVTMLTERANERLFLTQNEVEELQETLWNGLTEVVNHAMEPLSAELR